MKRALPTLSVLLPLREKVAAKRSDEGSRDAHRLADAVQYLMGIKRDLVVRETQDAELLGTKPVVAACVPFGIVERTIRLDNQPMAEANEVGDIGAERGLPPELEIIEPSVAEQLPEQALGESRLLTHPFSGA
jgi:hypothetical protein